MAHLTSEDGGVSELDKWINEFRHELEPKQKDHIYQTLMVNGFNSRLKLKLIGDEELNFMFNEGPPSLTLATKALLAYKIKLLRDESPLVTKSKPRSKDSVEKVQISETKNQNVIRSLQDQEEKLKQQLLEKKTELKEIDFNIESMRVDICAHANIGNGKSICGNCHHRGHRNQPTKPCVLNRCTAYTYCGIKDKHPEYFAKLNSLQLERRQKEKVIAEMENQLSSMHKFSTNSEFQFIKALTPRMYNVDQTYKTNKAKLMRDVRLLRQCLDGKIPPESTNDAEQLGLLIKKLKKTKGIASDDNFEFFPNNSKGFDCTSVSPLVKEKQFQDCNTTLEKNDCKVSAVRSKSTSSSESSDSSSSSDDGRKRRKEKKRRNKKKGKKKSKRISSCSAQSRLEYDSSEDDERQSTAYNYEQVRYPHAGFINPYLFYPNTMSMNLAPCQGHMYNPPPAYQHFATTTTTPFHISASNMVMNQANLPTCSRTVENIAHNTNTVVTTPTKAVEQPRMNISQSPTSR